MMPLPPNAVGGGVPQMPYLPQNSYPGQYPYQAAPPIMPMPLQSNGLQVPSQP